MTDPARTESRSTRARRAPARRGHHSRPPRLRRGAPRLERHDRQAARRSSRGAPTPTTSPIAVRFAAEHDLPIAVRGGGHNVAGTAVVDDGIVIDLSADARSAASTPRGRTVHVQGGATWADVDRVTAPLGLATPGGVVSETGVAGLALSGGVSSQRRLRRDDDRQPRLRGGGPRRRAAGARERRRERRPALGDPRRRRQLRRRHVVRAAPPRARPRRLPPRRRLPGRRTPRACWPAGATRSPARRTS